MSGRAASFALALCGLAIAVPARAWEPLSGSRPVWDGPAPYAINPNSADLGPTVTEMEARRGMEDWTTPTCSALQTDYRGTTTAIPGPADGVSVIGWVESGWGHSSNAIGVTGTRYTSSTIVEADMEMNGVHFTWTTAAGSGSSVNAYSIALHESGHYVGLGHSSDSNAIMFYAYSGGIGSMNADDETGICTLYPGGGGGPTDCTVTGCPSGQSCVDGSCVPDMPMGGGGGDTCAPCTTHSQCGDADDYCLMYPDSHAYCGRACASDSDCGMDRCRTLGNGARQCVRYDGDAASCSGGGAPSGCTADTDCAAGLRCDTSSGRCVATGGGTTPLGGACSAHAECASGVCFSGMCSQSCDWPSGACPTGFYCDGEATGACGPGVCLPGGAGAGALGDSCHDHPDCANQFCFEGRCTEPCNPESVGACPSGGICRVGGLPCRGGCGVAGSLGDPCTANAQCASGMCASADGRQFCTALCDASSPCPTGFACESAGSVNVCVPDGGALGGECASNADCATHICAVEDDRSYCTRLCDTGSPCPDDMACVDSSTPGVSVCQPVSSQGLAGRPSGVGGCAIGGARNPTSGAWLALVLLGTWLLRRGGRRRRRRGAPRRGVRRSAVGRSGSVGSKPAGARRRGVTQRLARIGRIGFVLAAALSAVAFVGCEGALVLDPGGGGGGGGGGSPPPRVDLVDAGGSGRVDAGTPRDAGGGTSPIGCDLPAAGLCDGTVARWCEGDEERSVDCASAGETCELQGNRVGCAPAGDPPPTGCGSADELRVIELANQARAMNGAGMVTCDEDMSRAARLHSQDMCQQGYFSHDSLDGRSPFDRMRDEGVTFGAAGENIAQGQRGPDEVHDAWMNSSGHRANILNGSFRRIGVGLDECNGRYYWTQNFAD
ncbi:MAG: CAP domain-containing protein [Sandaracinaceae bacterium]